MYLFTSDYRNLWFVENVLINKWNASNKVFRWWRQDLFCFRWHIIITSNLVLPISNSAVPVVFQLHFPCCKRIVVAPILKHTNFYINCRTIGRIKFGFGVIIRHLDTLGSALIVMDIFLQFHLDTGKNNVAQNKHNQLTGNLKWTNI